MLAILCTLQEKLLSMTCDEAFIEYKNTFQKVYHDNEEDKKQIFCFNFMQLQELLKTDPNLPVGIVERMDISHEETVQRAKSGQVNQLRTPRSEYCSALNPLPDLGTVYHSVDLREMKLMMPSKDQGQCGSCYMFQTMAVLENAILRDKKNLNAFWQSKANSSTFSLSEQFQLSNAICESCYYCNGGDFGVQTYLMVPGNYQLASSIKTVELTENFPYAYAAKKAAWQAGTAVAPKIAAANYLLPVKMFNNSGFYAAWCNKSAKVTPAVKIFDDDATTFNTTTIKTIKSYLSRGIAIAGAMSVGTGTTATAFQYYTGGSVLSAPCPKFDVDHAVTIVGYGKKKGKNVWVIKNSWGTGWGDKGVYFVEIGSNSYCTEHCAYTVIPKYFNMTETTAYPRGTLSRGTTNTLDCDYYYTNISKVIKCYDTICPTTYPNRVNGTSQCLTTCPTGKTCIVTCQPATPYKEASGKCVARCSTGAYSLVSGALTCQASCPKYFVTNTTNSNSKLCVTACTSSQTLNGTECKPVVNKISPAVKITLIVVVPLVTVGIIAIAVTAFVCRRKQNSSKGLKIKINEMKQNYTTPATFNVV
ncbi:Cathepsin_L [Hexamita inflata]|uniref:Cathepsin L n=1 Tax=Hexamita inflata TaxID=28002 RepID=A0AA86RBL4_9EUKA|nr:Cathepsin L [Hexamita inflata]